ncbi:MAG: acetyl-CoA carboxylase carboxyltransferase subunit beta [Spirochaetes bacterium]|nr:acetyl-CoA carboxylase carboxyltransferase subunit beta [Spirochaetota bacterium]
MDAPRSTWFEKPKYQNVKSLEENALPTGRWTKCPDCSEVFLKKQLEENLNVCVKCGHHFRIGAKERIRLLADEGTFREKFENIGAGDPLVFTDAKESYKDKIRNTVKKLKMNEGVITGTCRMGDFPAVLAVMEFSFLGGSMGSAIGEKIYQAMLLGIKNKCPVVTVAASGGARMHEGILSLMQMAKTCAGLERLGQNRVPYISILTDPTTGGVTASFASLGDVILAEPGALIGFAGPRVIEQTIRQKLPEGFQTAEFLRDHGFVDRVVPRAELKQAVVSLLQFFAS